MIVKINNFQGDLSDISAETATLVDTYLQIDTSMHERGAVQGDGLVLSTLSADVAAVHRLQAKHSRKDL